MKSLARITPLCFLVTGVLADSVCVGSNPTTQMSLLTPHVLAQKSSAPAQDRQKNADAFLRQARQAMKQGNLEAAASYLKRAEALEPEYDPVWNGLKDTPAQVRKDLARLQAASDTTLPSRQFNAQQPQTTRTGSGPNNPLSIQEREERFQELTNNSRAKATEFLKKSRLALQEQDLVGATAWYRKAVTENVTFSDDEYSPQRLAEDLIAAGVPQNDLAAVAIQLPSPLDFSPDSTDASRADRVPELEAAGFENGQGVLDRGLDTPVDTEQEDFATGLRRLPNPSRNASAAPLNSKREAMRLLAEAQAALDRDQAPLAKQLARQAENLNIPTDAFQDGETRPWQIIMMADQRLRRVAGRTTTNISDLPLDQPKSGGGSQNTTYPVQQSVFRPEQDRTKIAATQAESPAAPQPIPAAPRSPGKVGSKGLELFAQGDQALLKQDVDTALQHYREAWLYEDELDPVTRQRLRDKLSQLRARARRIDGAPSAASPLEEINAVEQIVLQKLSREISTEQKEAERISKTDPKGALTHLQRLRTRVREAEVDGASKKQLLTIVERSISSLTLFIERNRNEIELKERNRDTLAQIENERFQTLDTQNKLAELVEKFNTLMDENRHAEAEVIAKQAKAIAPESPVVTNLMWKSRFARRLAENFAIRDGKENEYVDSMTSIDRASSPFDDSRPYRHGNSTDWDDLTSKRLSSSEMGEQRLTPAEIEIQKKLKDKIDARFDGEPLGDVLQQLGEYCGINLVLDPEGLAAEGVTPDVLVTLNLTQPITLRSTLNLILEPLRLSYVTENEVLKITSERTRESKVAAKVYNVADLVLPIPNFVSDDNVGLPSAIRENYNTLGYGGSGFLGAAGGQGTSNAAVLAQMGANGMMSNTPSGNQTVNMGQGTLGGAAAADFDSLIDLITSTIAPESWDEVGGPGAIQGFASNLSLVVSQTQEVHEELTDLLDQLRRLQDLQVTIEVRYITLNDDFFERIGVDFDFDILDNTGLTPAEVANRTDSNPSLTIGIGPDGQPTTDLDVSFSQGSFNSAVAGFGGFDAATAARFGFAILSDIEAFFLVEASHGDSRTNVMQAPKVTLFNGQTAMVMDISQRPFVTGVVPVVGDFAAAQQPIITVLNEGTTLSVQAVVSSDRRFVRLTLVPMFSQIEDVREFTFDGKTITTVGTSEIITPDGLDEDTDPDQTATAANGTEERQGTTVQQPVFNITSVMTTVSVPDGGTVLLGGIKRLSEQRVERGVPILAKLPYINRLFKNVGIGRETSSLMMMVTPRIIIQEEEELLQTGYDSSTD